ncbi:MAG: 4Fe-4S binding protein, partial [Methanomicrobiales archaeon]|nr:4Fe-4S binding protein [Methanomicrobiales archaeon]
MFDSYRENTLEYYPELCINCGRCSQVCPHGVFARGETKAVLARPAGCMECGACALNCPTRAIGVESGVGCAWAMIAAALRGRDMDACTCGGPGDSCCGGGEEESHSCCGGDEKEESPSCCSDPEETCCGGAEEE